METAMPCARACCLHIIFGMPVPLRRGYDDASGHGRGILAFTDGRLITHASSPFTEIAELGHGGAVIIG